MGAVRRERARLGHSLLAGDALAFSGRRHDRRRRCEPPNDLYFASLVGLLMTGIVVVITNYYTSMSYRPVRKIAKASETGTRDQHHCRPRHWSARHRVAGRFYWPRNFVQLSFRRALRHRDRGHEHALDGRHHHFARCLRSDHGQRRRHRGHEQSAEGSARRDRRTRRRRQHDESGDQRLRHRFGRAWRRWCFSVPTSRNCGRIIASNRRSLFISNFR